MGVRGMLGFLVEMYKLQLSTVLEYRSAFIMQSLGMILNDVCWLFFWFILYQRFTSINGWDFHAVMLLYAVFAGCIGTISLLVSNVYGLSSLIENGGLDYYLSLPKPVLLHAIIKTTYHGVGDIIFGFGLALWILPLHMMPLYICTVLTGTLIFLGWSIFFQSITFYVGRFDKAAKAARDALIIFAGYPFSVYSGMTKFVLMFIVPVGMIIGVPVELLQKFNWEWFLLLLVFTFAFFLLCVSFFYLGLRRYSSGNTMGMRG